MNILEQAKLTIKQYSFGVMKETMSQFMCSSLIYKLFCVVELAQNLYFVMHPILKFEIQTIVIEYLRQVIQYTQLTYILDAMDQTQTIIILYTAFCLQFAFFFLIGIGVAFVYQKKKITTFTSYAFKMISFYGLLLNTMLYNCFQNVFLIFLLCYPDSQFSYGVECYQGIYIVHTIMSAFGALFYLIIQYYIVTFYIDLNISVCQISPFSEVPFAQCQSRFDNTKLIMCFTTLLNIVKDYNYGSPEVYIVTLLIKFTILLGTRIYESAHFHQDVYNFLLGCNAIQFTVCFAYMLHKFLDAGPSDNVGLYFIIIALPFVYFCCLQIVHKKNLYILKLGIKKLELADSHEKYYALLVHIISKREETFNYILLEGILVQHMETCQIINCPCTILRESKTKDLDETQWYNFVIQLTEYSLTKFPKSCKIYLFQSYIQNQKLDNKFKCYYAIQHIKLLEPTLKEEFQIFRDEHILEEVMQEEDQKADIVIDVLQVVKFQKYYGQFQTQLEESVRKHYEFWSELLEINPDIQKLFSLGNQITQSVEDVRNIYDKLNEINPNHINTLKIFGQFQLDVINSDNYGQRILDKANQIESAQSNSNEATTDKYGENSNTCIMTCSAEIKSLGQIQTCNKEIDKLGYHKYELINQLVTRLMPKCYADSHDKFMIRYLETNQSKVVGLERIVYCQHKNGYILPCKLMFKILPQLKKGLKMVSFLKVEENHENYYYILFNPNSFLVYGLSKNCQESFGLPINLAYGNIAHSNEFTMEIFIQDFKHLSDRMKNTETSSFHLTIDTTNLKKMFILEDSVDGLSQMEEDPQNQNLDQSNLKHSQKEESKFKTQRVKCNLIREQYLDMEVAILKFSETIETQEGQRSGNYYQSEIKLKSKQSKYSTSTTRKKENKQQQINEDYLNEDRSSVNSVQSSLNDDLRKLKDFKALMSEKNVPRNIRTIQITMLSLTLILLTVSIVDLALKNTQNESFKYSSQIMADVHSRTNFMSTIAFHSRLLQLRGIGKYYTTNGLTQTFLQSDLLTRLESVQQLQFDTLKVKNNLKKQGVLIPTQFNYNFTSLLMNNNTQDTILTVIDGIRETISHLIIFIGSDLINLNDTDFISPIQQSFFFINYNSVRNTRIGLEERTKQFFNFFDDLASSKFSIFLTLMIISIIILIITHAIVIPILLKVDKANNKVLSMFGLISQAEIKELSEKCEKFLKEYIEDYNEKKELEIKLKKDEQQQKIEQNKHYIEVNNEEHPEDKEKEEQERKRQIEEQLEKERLERERLEKIEEEKRKKHEEEKRLQQKYGYRKKKKHKYQIEEIELSEEEKERVEKLERSNEKNDSTALIKFMFFFVIFTGFFVVQLILEVLYLDDIHFLFNHLKLANQRYEITMYRIFYGLEDVIQQQSVTFDDLWLSQYYHNLIYDSERSVFESYKSFQLTGYDTYLKYYDWFNFNDMCQNVSLFDSLDSTISANECVNVQNGILQKGLRTSVINLALYANDSLTNTANITKVLNEDPLQNLIDLVKYIRPAFNTLNVAFLSDSFDYIDYAQTIEIIKFVILILAWIIMFFIIWMPYLTKLSKQIWQTKGMLNMIPMAIIQKNEKLKYRFLQDNIMTMVQ